MVGNYGIPKKGPKRKFLEGDTPPQKGGGPFPILDGKPLFPKGVDQPTFLGVKEGFWTPIRSCVGRLKFPWAFPPIFLVPTF